MLQWIALIVFFLGADAFAGVVSHCFDPLDTDSSYQIEVVENDRGEVDLTLAKEGDVEGEFQILDQLQCQEAPQPSTYRKHNLMYRCDRENRWDEGFGVLIGVSAENKSTAFVFQLHFAGAQQVAQLTCE